MQAATTKLHIAGEDQQSTKRRANDMSDTDDGFEQMDIDQDKSKRFSEDEEDEEEDEEDTDNGGRSTPQPLEEEENATIDDENDDDNNVKSHPLIETEHSSAMLGRTEISKHSSAKEAAPPPRRELPFTRRGPTTTPESISGPREIAEETAGETDDDEL